MHDQVLARLLDLNQKRHEEEILGGKQAEKKAKGKTKPFTASESEASQLQLLDNE